MVGIQRRPQRPYLRDLQPGPASLTEGVRQIHAILAHVAGVPVAEALRPAEKLDPHLLLKLS
jgi:hypothetical protein